MIHQLCSRARRALVHPRRSLFVVLALALVADTGLGLGDPPDRVHPVAAGDPVAASLAPTTTTAAPTTTTTVPVTTTTAPPPTTTTTAPPKPEPLVDDPMLPEGKGMWIWQPHRTNGGDPRRITDQAVGMGLTHIYVRTGSSRMGNHGIGFVDALLPVAHEAGLRVYGWDFPYLNDVPADVHRIYTAIHHEAPGGHRLDGFVADIETPSEGTHLTAEGVSYFSERLRAVSGADYPLMVAVPRPSAAMINRYPYDAVIPHYSAVLPMVYWLNRQPDSDVHGAVEWLARYEKPILPIGQAYDGAPEGGRPGPPPPEEINRFLDTAHALDARAVSFWSWQHASDEIWWAIAEHPGFQPDA